MAYILHNTQVGILLVESLLYSGRIIKGTLNNYQKIKVGGLIVREIELLVLYGDFKTWHKTTIN